MVFLESLTERRTVINLLRFALFFFCSTLLISFLAAFNDQEVNFGRLIYVIAFLNVSIFPFFHMDKTKGRYILLVIFMPLYFIFFCIGDLFSILGIENKALKESIEIQNTVDSIIIYGLIAYIIGYLSIARNGFKQGKGWFYEEWDHSRTVIFGVCCYILGTWAFITTYFLSETSNLPLSIVSNLKQFTLIGELMLIYTYISTKNKSTLFILIFIGLFDFCLGFVANTKEVSFAMPTVFLFIAFLATGKVNKILVCGLIAVLIIFQGYFNAYRLFVIQIPKKTPLYAVSNFSQSLETVLKNRYNTRHVDNRTKASTAIKERIETRKYLVILVDGFEKGVRSMDGYTIGLFFKSFIPRVMWPEKPEISTGKLFNQEFKISASKLTYIPATHIGEFYWNYGMAGAIIGMGLVGVFMAFISTVTDLSAKITLPRVIVLMMTIYLVCVRFEQDWAQQYSNVVRALGAVWLLNLLLRKRPVGYQTALDSVSTVGVK